jgi:hypothetical protein
VDGNLLGQGREETGLVEVPANWCIEDDLSPMVFMKGVASSGGLAGCHFLVVWTKVDHEAGPF